jgi:hypothetical protein
MTTVVIYGCLDPMTNELRYVGKTNIKEGKTVEYSLKRRLAQHCRNSGRSYRECWLQSLLRKGVKPVIVAIRGRLQKRTDAAKHSTSLTLKEFYSNTESRLAHSE